jgi:hypothetical protein
MSRFRLGSPADMRVDKSIENPKAEGTKRGAENDATSVVGR